MKFDMPIIKTDENNIQVQFGAGDILIGSGMMGDYEQGLVTLVQQEPKPIGTYVKHENPFVEMEAIPVSLIFQKVESLDVLIERLQKTRKYMTGELDIKSEIE
jgi:hypothetical protein